MKAESFILPNGLLLEIITDNHTLSLSLIVDETSVNTGQLYRDMTIFAHSVFGPPVTVIDF